MDCLTIDDILEADDIDIKKVEVPEWGGYVYLKEMSAADAERVSLEMLGDDNQPDKDKMVNMHARYVARCLCDSEGKRTFPEEKVLLLGVKSSKVVSRLYRMALKLNGDDKTMKDAQRKNSDPSGTASSSD